MVCWCNDAPKWSKGYFDVFDKGFKLCLFFVCNGVQLSVQKLDRVRMTLMERVDLMELSLFDMIVRSFGSVTQRL